MDETQYAVDEDFLKTHYFGTKEDDLRYQEFLSTLSKEERKKSKHPSQLLAEEFGKTLVNPSAVGHNDDGIYYITEENQLSKAIVQGIAKAVEQFKLRVELGMEWITGDNWAECH